MSFISNLVESRFEYFDFVFGYIIELFIKKLFVLYHNMYYRMKKLDLKKSIGSSAENFKG
jgi:hypothetical protein